MNCAGFTDEELGFTCGALKFMIDEDPYVGTANRNKINKCADICIKKLKYGDNQLTANQYETLLAALSYLLLTINDTFEYQTKVVEFDLVRDTKKFKPIIYSAMDKIKLTLLHEYGIDADAD